jgi:hypothetical protein
VERTYEGVGVNFDFFAKYKLLRWNNIGIEAGLRLSPSRMTSFPGPVLFPNINVTYRPIEKLGLKGAFGVLRQEIIAYTDDNDVIAIFEPYIVLPDYLSPARAVHYSSGIEYNFSRETTLELEGYYKQLINLPELNRDKIFARDPDMISVAGESYGMEVLIKHMTSDFYTSLAYTLSWSFKGSGSDRYFPRYDARHNINLIMGVELGSGWSTSAVFAFSSGLPFTQSRGFYDKLYINQLWDPWVIMQPYLPYSLLGERNAARLPVYHRLDLNLSKKFVLFFMAATFEVNVLNVYNRKNIFYFDRDTGERVNMLPLLPTATLRIEI